MLPSIPLTLSNVALGAFLLLVGFIIYYLYITPKRLLKFYENQGIQMEYKFGIGYFYTNFDNVKKKGDFFHSWKEFGRKGAPGGAFGGNLAGIAHLVLVDPALIKAFYISHDRYYIKNKQWSAIWRKLFEHGLLLAEGQEWKRHRKLISGAFQHDLLRDMTPDVARIVDRSFEELKTRDISNVSIMEEFQNITGELIGSLFFGEEFHTYRLKGIRVSLFLADLIARMSKENFALHVMLFGSKILDLGLTKTHRGILEDTKLFREFAVKIIEKKFEEAKINPAEAKTKKNIIDVMLAQRVLNPQDQLTDMEIIEEFVTFFAAGMDTTGHTVTLATYFLLKNPQFREKLMNEVEENFQDVSKITLDTLNKCEIALAFMKETLRYMHPASAIFDRIALEDHKIGYLKIKKGTSVNVGYVSNNFHPDYHDNADTFDIDRWLTPSKTRESTSKDPYVFIPFSSGTRNCIGQHFAMIQARMIFCMFLKKFDFYLDPSYKLKMCLRFLYEPVDEIRYKLTPRV